MALLVIITTIQTSLAEHEPSVQFNSQSLTTARLLSLTSLRVITRFHL